MQQFGYLTVNDEMLEEENNIDFSYEESTTAREAEKEFFEQKIKDLRSEIEEMKLKRAEDMKANERVLAIFASKEEAWKREKKKLELELDSLRQIHEESNKPCGNDCRSENEKGCNILKESLSKPTVDEVMQNLAKEVEQRKLEHTRYVSAIAELKDKKHKVEIMLRNALVEIRAWKRDAALKTKEKAHVDVVLRKVTEEVLKLQKEVDDKDDIISVLSKKDTMRVRDSAEAELKAMELQLSNAKSVLKQYIDAELTQERDVEKWKKLYLAIKVELDILQIQKNTAQNEYHTEGELVRSFSTGRVEADLERKFLAEKGCLHREIKAKDERIEGLRKQLIGMEKETVNRETEIDCLRQSLRIAHAEKVEAEKEVNSMRQILSSCCPTIQTMSNSSQLTQKMIMREKVTQEGRSDPRHAGHKKDTRPSRKVL